MGRPQEREVRVEKVAPWEIVPNRLKERFAEEQPRGHATEGPQVQATPEA